MTEHTLAELEEKSGVNARTIRSWIEQGLLPRPLGAGPKATYPSQALTRLLAIKAMKDTYGMSLSAIRQEMVSADWGKIEGYASQSETGQQALPSTLGTSGALDYLAKLKATGVFKGSGLSSAQVAPTAPTIAQSRSPLVQLADVLERLAQGRKPARRAKSQVQTTIPVTPDIDIVVRGSLSADEAALYERVADHLREILAGGELNV